MGQNESLPILTENLLSISIPNGNLTEIPYFIPPENSINSIDVPYNQIKKFPLSLPNLKVLDISNNNLSQVDFDDVQFSLILLKYLTYLIMDFQKIPQQLKEMKSIKNLNLEHNELTEETSDFSSLSKLQILNLFLNRFTNFPNFPDSLEVLNIGFNSIRSISFFLPKISELRLSGNEITEVSEDCFFPSLKLLDLSLNRLVEFPNLMKISPNIEEFYCSYNFLETTPTEIPLSIVTLDLSHNILTELSIDFTNHQNLLKLDISNNRIQTVPQLPANIESFSAQFNAISSITTPTFTKPIILNFTSNEFTSIPNLKQCQSHFLFMKDNKINKIDIENISLSTQQLVLTNNRINEIPETISLLNSLKVLNLTLNRITSLPSSISSLKLNTLIICENNISDLPELPTTLTTLIAFKCNFGEIPESVYKVPRLNFIDFSCNHISTLATLPKVTQISLSSNDLKEIPSIPDSISILNLSFNRIKKFILTNGKYLQELDLSHNQLKKFKTTKLTFLSTLNLSHNPLKSKLHFSNFPVLTTIDITKTNISSPKHPIPLNIIEFITSNPQIVKQNPQNKSISLYSCENVGYSGNERISSHDEDTIVVRRNILPGIDIFSVIDGHGGQESAHLASYYIPLLFLSLTNKSISGFSSMVKDLDIILHQNDVKDGAVLVFTLISQNEIGCAHLGDARAIVVRKDGNIIPLTIDHKATERTEIDLVKENRSYIESKRTAGILAISRAIGDFRVPGVTRTPDMTSYNRQKNDFRLVLGCDGLFDVVSNEEIGIIVRDNADVDFAAFLLRNTAFARGSMDNISVIVVDIEKINV